YSAKQECFALALKIVRKPLLYLFHSRLGLAVDHSRDDLIHHLGPECRGISILELETVRLKRRTASACNVKNTGPQCGLRISRNSAVAVFSNSRVVAIGTSSITGTELLFASLAVQTTNGRQKRF